MDTGSFLGVNRQGPGVDHPPPFNAKVKKKQGYTSTPPLGLRGLILSDLYLYFLFLIVNLLAVVILSFLTNF